MQWMNVHNGDGDDGRMKWMQWMNGWKLGDRLLLSCRCLCRKSFKTIGEHSTLEKEKLFN